mgnify:CR=1 FL=1
MAYTGKKISVKEIAKYGNILKVVPREEAFEAAMDTAREITANWLITSNTICQAELAS